MGEAPFTFGDVRGDVRVRCGVLESSASADIPSGGLVSPVSEICDPFTPSPILSSSPLPARLPFVPCLRRSVVTRPKLIFSASAKDVTLFEPPGFLLTTTASFHPGTWFLIHLAIRGSAWRLSTGLPKKPWVGGACRSTVMTWLIPATERRLATNRAVMAPLCDFFFDWRE